MMNFSAYSIKNPLVAILLFTLLMLGGMVGFKQMKIQQFPDIDLPAVVTTITMQGVAPTQLESDIAKKVENKIASLEGVKHIRTTITTGAVTVSTEFRLEKDIQEALDDVRSAVSEARGDLPASADEPIISKVTTSGYPVAGYSVTAKNMNEDALSWWVDDTLNKRLSDLAGVGKISRVGGIERQIIIEPNINTLNGWQMPLSTFSQSIANLWQDLSGGSAKIGNGTQTVRILGSSDSLDDLKNLNINTPTGTTRLSDIAQVYDGQADLSSQALLDGQKVVAFNVTRSRGASEVSVVALIDQEIAKIQAQNPNITINKLYDHAKPVQEDYNASLQMLIEGCILAVVVVFVFLKDWRATIVGAVALPLSIVPAFLVMNVFGFSLNVISLLALSLVIGVLVDDAIVEIENIMRHLQMGKTPYQASLEASNEIGLAVIATTFTLIAVFLPTAFMGGVVGQFFRQFGWTASIAIFISLLVARLITPMMSAYFLKAQKPHDEKVGNIMQTYLNLVDWTIRHRFLTLLITLVMFVASLSLAKFLPVAFMPDDDSDQTQVTITLTPDATIDDTIAVSQKAQHLVSHLEGVEQVFVAVGSSSAKLGDKNHSGGSVNGASMDITLKPRGTRPSKSNIENAIRTELQKVAGAKFSVGLSAGGESGYNFSLTSSSPALLNQTVMTVVKDINQLGNVKVSTNESLPKPEISVRPNSLALADKGVSTVNLANTLRIATTGDYEQALPKMNFDTRQIPIVIRLPDADKKSLTTLASLYVPSSTASVQVSQVASLAFDTGDSTISRMDRERAVKITVESDLPLGELSQNIKALKSMTNLPEGVNLIEEGQAESMNELFSGFVLAMGVGVLCIFGVLMLLFGRVLQPFTILMALPLSVGGAFLGLLITKSGLSTPSMIGLIMLMGIATKNSILLVDYAIIAQKEGANQLLAIMDACQKRARPIIMTTIAMGAGMLPLVLGLSEADSSFRRPMAAAVLGGLITSTFLSLVVIPVVYTLMDDLGNFFKKTNTQS